MKYRKAIFLIYMHIPQLNVILDKKIYLKHTLFV
jgi:hypothetical protein